MAVSALKGSGLTVYSLVFQVSTGTLKSDSRGNKVPVTADSTVEARLKPTGNPSLRALVGADEKTVVLTGRCVDPSELPEGVRDGSTAALTINGQAGVFRLVTGFPSAVAEVDAILGQPITGTWRAQ